MVAAGRKEKIGRSGDEEVPVVDMSWGKRGEVAKEIVKACEEYGFFKVVNHGVRAEVIGRMEEESYRFFGKPAGEKRQAGPANPCGYGSKSIGLGGDVGEVEYLLLHTDLPSISHRAISISHDPTKFSCAVSGYIEAVRELACELLDLMAEGLWVTDTSVFSRLISAVDSDSLFRLNHYPTSPMGGSNGWDADMSPPTCHRASNSSSSSSRIGFGEHSDPQILTILRSNDVGGLQISVGDGVWVPVPPDPTSFYVNVGDVLQAMTNGRFVSVRHRVLANSSHKPRMSMAYFGAPPPHAKITCPPELVTPQRPSRYRPFTWEEYKKAMYSLRLGDDRLDLFKNCTDDEAALM
ncbi:gibberellin 2-beta-dioxygenase 6-like [Malania oleifera]|uniref:gibberellin 2-beta-dioxygenase 6-like n=1 Tax=Malania oleifera TaxID=397392 RepID=UPI0025ADD971|nr:gibberellin 2-beta-dioxygenase 6-like [Malania oleifera]